MVPSWRALHAWNRGVRHSLKPKSRSRRGNNTQEDDYRGFDGIETARKYLHLFELTYRFTLFAKDNRPVKGRELDIRGECLLQLAGYDISHMPFA